MSITNELYAALRRLTCSADACVLCRHTPEHQAALRQAYAAMAKAKGVRLEPVACEIKPFFRIGKEI